MTTATKPAPSAARPAWFHDQLLGAFEASEAHAFLLHGGIADYVLPNYPVLRYLQKALGAAFEVVATYSVSRGVTFPTPQMAKRFRQILPPEGEDAESDGPILMAPTPAIDLLLRFLKKAPKQTACVIIDRIDFMVGTDVPVAAELFEAIEMLHNAGTDPELETRGNPLIMLAPSLERVREDVRAISSGIRGIEVPMPDYDARLAFIRQRLVEEEEVILAGITEEQFAALTAGLYRRHIEDVILRARQNNGKLTRQLAVERQRELMDMEYGGIVKRIDKPFKLADVGGHAEAKAYFQQRAIEPMRAGKTARVPSNVLLVGPPGTGKTLLANAVANESGINCLEVDLSALLGGIVGQTEANLAKLRQAAVANAPTILIMDEVDQKMRRGQGGADPGGGGSVENRVFSSLLELVGDPMLKGKVMGLFMSNRPDLLDAAFVSRMQAIIPILPAESDTARAAVMGAIIRRLGGGVADDNPTLVALAKRVIDWSGRDLEQVVDEALAMAELEGQPMLAAIDEAITYRKPNTRDVQRQVVEALKACNNLKLMPEKYRTLAAQQPEPAEVEEPEQGRRQRRSLDIS